MEVVADLLAVGVLFDKQKKAFEFRIEFLAFDNRDKDRKRGKVDFYPLSFQDDLNVVAAEAFKIRENRIDAFDRQVYKSLLASTEKWILDLQTEGYLDQL